MKLAVVSPLPPDRSGVADFTARLVRELSAHFDVEARREGDSGWLERADRRLYQIGNNPLHAGAYDAALLVPGVVELHDAVLQHFYLGRLGREAYVAEHVYNGGEPARSEAERLWKRRGQASTDEAFFRRPLLKRIAGAAERVIVHNPGAAAAVREAAPGADIIEIPHFADPREAATGELRAAARAELGVADGDLLISCFGFQRPSKRLRSVLRAAERLQAPHRVLIAGEFVSADYEQSLAQWLSSDRVVRRPYVSEAELERLAAATDVCANLRWPAAGESSGIAMRLMAWGVPTLVTTGLETSAYSDSAVVRIDPGEIEEDMLAETLELLAERPELRRAVGEAGRGHLRREHSMDRVLRLYLEALA